VEEPAAEETDGHADPEGGVGVVVDAEGFQGFVGEVDQLFMCEIDGVGPIGYESGKAG